MRLHPWFKILGELILCFNLEPLNPVDEMGVHGARTPCPSGLPSWTDATPTDAPRQRRDARRRPVPISTEPASARAGPAPPVRFDPRHPRSTGFSEFSGPPKGWKPADLRRIIDTAVWLRTTSPRNRRHRELSPEKIGEGYITSTFLVLVREIEKLCCVCFRISARYLAGAQGKSKLQSLTAVFKHTSFLIFDLT